MRRFAQQQLRTSLSTTKKFTTPTFNLSTTPHSSPSNTLYLNHFTPRFTLKRHFSSQQPPQLTASIAEPNPYPVQPPPASPPLPPPEVPLTPPPPTIAPLPASKDGFFQRNPWFIWQLLTTLPLAGLVGYQQLVINEIVLHTKGVEDAVEQFSDILEYHHNVIAEMVEFPDEYYNAQDSFQQPQAPQRGYPQSRFPGGGNNYQTPPQNSNFRPPSPPPSMQSPPPPPPTTPQQPRQQYQSRSNLFNNNDGSGMPPPPSRDQQRVPPYQ